MISYVITAVDIGMSSVVGSPIDATTWEEILAACEQVGVRRAQTTAFVEAR